MNPDNKIPLVRHCIGQLDTYDVTADELDRIQQECMDVGQDFQVASICGTAGVSFLIALLATKIDSQRVWDGFFIVTVLGFGGAIYFGRKYVQKKRVFKPIIQRIKERKADVGPVGEQGHEVPVAELAAMPVMQADAQVVHAADTIQLAEPTLAPQQAARTPGE